MQSSKARFLSLSMLLFILTCIGIFSSPYAPDNDLYLHLIRGEWMIKTWSLLRTDIFTYTQTATPDEAIHSWLAQLIFFKIHHWSGVSGLRYINVILVYSTLILLFNWLKKLTDSSTLALIGAGLGLALHQRYQLLRPFLFGEFFFALFVFMLFDYSLKPTRRLYLVLATALWANCHASVVILPFLYLAWAIGQFFQKGQRRELLLNTSTIFFATLINPQGLGIYRYAFELSSLGKQMGGSEWQVHWPFEIIGSLSNFQGIKFYYDINQLILALSGIALLFIFFRKQLKTYPVIFLAVACCSLALISNRHLIYLLFPLAFTLQFFFQKYRILLNRLYVPTFVLMPFFLFFIGFHESYQVEPSVLQATRFLRAISFNGNIFNFHTWGSFLIYELYPNARVASDARSRIHQDFLLTVNKLNPLPLEERRKKVLELIPNDTDLLFLSTSSQSWQPLLERIGYVQVYENNVVTLAIKSVPKSAALLNRIEQYYKIIGIPFQRSTGMSLEQAVLHNPQWAVENTEIINWGVWPVPLVQSRWASSQVQLFTSRRLPVPSSIHELLKTHSGSSHGGVRSFTLNFRETPRKILSALY